MKHFFLLLLGIIFTIGGFAQGIGRNGQNATSKAEFVDKYGRIVSIPSLNRYGQESPQQSGVIVGLTTICASQADVVYSVAAIPRAFGYVWTYTGEGFSIVSGDNTNRITVRFSSSATSGILTVCGVNPTGKGLASINFPITVNSLSETPQGVDGSTSILAGASTTLKLSGGIAGTEAVSQWYSGSCSGSFVGTGPQVVVSPSTTTTYYVRYSGTCNTTTCFPVTVTVGGVATVDAGPAMSAICQGGTSGDLGGTLGGGATGGYWSSSVGGVFTPNASALNASWTPPASYLGTAELVLTAYDANHNIISSSKNIEVVANPSIAEAGEDIYQVESNPKVILAANTPTVGNGHWSVVSGDALIASPDIPNSEVNGLKVPGTAVLRWTISNSVCEPATDDVVITITRPNVICKDKLTINHKAGAIAPVDQTIVYGTVASTLTGTNKCWISQNLGASQQASAMDDAKEASAGWYWQFNRKQGYTVTDEGSRKPESTWITGIDEDTNWLMGNDPCTLELGAGWRIPTSTEWKSVMEQWKDPWDSELKIHNSGCLFDKDGLLNSRGAKLFFWSSSQFNSQLGYYLYTDYNSFTFKSFGYPLRCLWDTPSKASLLTSGVVSITTNSASCGASHLVENGTPILAKGICWSTSPSPTIVLNTQTLDGSGSADFISSLTGLEPYTTYYVRAYATNGSGTAYGNEVSFTTADLPFVSCGDRLTVNHQAGVVAPVDKMVIYGTVTSKLSGIKKCWITQNLGSSRQATSYDDATEAASGWYWQFNRKQGIECRSSRIPAVTWNSSISEELDWQAVNDPCTIELGAGWRIPTRTEWSTAGSFWTNWTHPWNTVLKLHAAGFLYVFSGNLMNRGVDGYYWSSTQDNDDGTKPISGWMSHFSDGFYQTQTIDKAYGSSLRCLQDVLALPELQTNPVREITTTTAICGANSIDDSGVAIVAKGICWSTSPKPTILLSTKTQSGAGTDDFLSEMSGLSPLTMYYVRAYATNGVGTSYGPEISFTTSAEPFAACGDKLTVNHQAGAVAPENKMIVYSTVVSGLTGYNKCWISQNLGASQQAKTIDDATEAAAGWLWQFNRKQGYMVLNDRVTRTPSTPWITKIEEESDWLPENDPCTIELGEGWRIPTHTEWKNVLAQSDNLWESELKMHYSGFFIDEGTMLAGRADVGLYHCSTLFHTDLCYGVDINGLVPYFIGSAPKSVGQSVRCINDCMDVPAPTGPAVQNIYQGATVARLSAKGKQIQWYLTPTGGTAIAESTPLEEGTHYYASQSDCRESKERLDVLVSLVFACGESSLTVNHTLGGGVAPETKTVTYTTVQNMLGDAGRCWITSNLGASRVPKSGDDATEASAGWYWQFNRRQGYRLADDGVTRTPSDYWDPELPGESDWYSETDPCTLELGSGWRIPTRSEWKSVSDNWSDYWNSNLKLHAAGYLNKLDASLNNRGLDGIYWSSNQNDSQSGWAMGFGSYANYMNVIPNSQGLSLRCLRDCTPPQAPTGNSLQTLNTGATVAQLVATGTAIKWYSSALSTKVLDNSTLLVDGAHYYASQTDCSESTERLDVTVKLVFTCGSSTLTIHHTYLGGVAPENKTITYGTVLSGLVSSNKCWISQNLGAERQASSPSDASTESAGWYWQFNLKQGYKSTGTSGNELSPPFPTEYQYTVQDWDVKNDPCTLELGSNWRMPTFSEWNQEYEMGGWLDYDDDATGTFGSVLKLHAAGFVSSQRINSRGIEGRYWNEDDGTSGYLGCAITMKSDKCQFLLCAKPYGFPLRCVSECPSSAKPTGAAAQTFQEGATVDQLEATGSSIKWYTVPTGGEALAGSTSLVDGVHYYASQTECRESTERLEVTVTVITAPFYCGSSNLIVRHLASGGVAPVDKTVSYSTYLNYPYNDTETCWILQNLGASKVAKSTGDNDEATAGWYWQFNRKQGYRHTGATATDVLTPAWPMNITENTDWLPANDPCTLELGAGWRIPTYWEWYFAGNYNSTFKFHAGGYLENGALVNRGVDGGYWSSYKNGASEAWIHGFGSLANYPQSASRMFGLSVRCLKECPIPAKPTGNSIQTFVEGATVAQLVAVGKNIKWYPPFDESESGDLPLPASTILEDGAHYFASQTDCSESNDRFEVTVKLISPPFACGTSTLKVNHNTTNGVAPEDKSIRYGTVVSGVYGSGACWIAQNLGADAQASSATDGAETSSGWYWQFNSKQGYKYTSTYQIPEWPEGYSYETGDWAASSDPCTIELGLGWRLPTRSEWDKEDATGNWWGYGDDKNGAFGSPLKLHAAGFLNGGDGSLAERGIVGRYWSNQEVSADKLGYTLGFGSNFSAINQSDKSLGLSVRCINDCKSPVPEGEAIQSFYSGATVAQLVATGINVQWYTSPVGGVALASTTILENGVHYYASQTNCVESTDRLDVTVKITANSFSCGLSALMIKHTSAGGVAPIDQTIFYNTENNLNGEPNKCWLTQDLGAASTPESFVDENAESLGWFWQFNRKQGYQIGVDGKTRTPENSWTTNISEESNWLAANDPCSIELGGGWRIPTMTEWNNVSADWTWDEFDPFNVEFMFHASGYLSGNEGVLVNRTSDCGYWSSDQYNVNNGRHLGFGSFNKFEDKSSKSNGFSVRCITDCTSPQAPGGDPIQIFYSGATVAQLSASGSTIQWYQSPTYWSPLVESTQLVDGTRYYASQTYCSESKERLEVLVKVIPFTCGTSVLTINHVTSDGIAPVEKTIQYKTVSSEAGGVAQCWIAQNLGAEKQASSPTDETAASAGWYWQFNNKQGHQISEDGKLRKPTIEWTTISEEEEITNWSIENDPCGIELGDNWRIPTLMEWTNVANSWGTGYGAVYASALKLHAAGALNSADGTLDNRGLKGFYWSNEQNDLQNGNVLTFDGFSTKVEVGKIVEGYPLRCLKDCKTPAAPTGKQNQSFLTGAMVDHLVAKGNQIRWYTSPVGGEALSGSTQLTNGTHYYASQTECCESSDRLDVMVSIINAPVLGSSYQGGYVAYLLTNNDPGYEEFVPHGLIVAERDQSASIQWGKGSEIYLGARVTAIGSGNTNTEIIVAKLTDTGSYAAKLCRDYVNPNIGTGVYTDWFLPSRDELYKICENHTMLPNFFHFDTYWSSSESNSSYACCQYLYLCKPEYNYSKNGKLRVRAVRAF